MTPLHIASEKGDRINIVKCLVGKADINIKDVNGVNACDYTTSGRLLLI